MKKILIISSLIFALYSCGDDCPPFSRTKVLSESIRGTFGVLVSFQTEVDSLRGFTTTGSLRFATRSSNTSAMRLQIEMIEKDKLSGNEINRYYIVVNSEEVTLYGKPYNVSIDHHETADIFGVGTKTPIHISGWVKETVLARCEPYHPSFNCDLRITTDSPDGPVTILVTHDPLNTFLYH